MSRSTAHLILIAVLLGCRDDKPPAVAPNAERPGRVESPAPETPAPYLPEQDPAADLDLGSGTTGPITSWAGYSGGGGSGGSGGMAGMGGIPSTEP
jgi:hypothetical protein